MYVIIKFTKSFYRGQAIYIDCFNYLIITHYYAITTTTQSSTVIPLLHQLEGQKLLDI